MRILIPVSSSVIRMFLMIARNVKVEELEFYVELLYERVNILKLLSYVNTMAKLHFFAL